MAKSAIHVLQPAGDLHERVVQGLKSLLGAFLRATAQVFQMAQVVGKRRERRDIGDRRTGGGADSAARIGLDHRFGRMAGRLDDVFVIGRHIVFDGRETAFEDGGQLDGMLGARLADQLRQMGDLVFQRPQRRVVAGGCCGRLVQPGGDVVELAFEAAHGRVVMRASDGMLRLEFEFLDAAGEVIQPFGQHVVDRALFERVDLAGDIGEVIGQFRRGRGFLRAFHQQRKLLQPFVEPHGGFLMRHVLDAGGQRLDAGAKLGGRVGPVHGLAADGIDLFGQRRQAVFQPLHGVIVGRGRGPTGGGDGAADLVKTQVEAGELLADPVIVGGHTLAKRLDGMGDAHQLVFQRMDCRAIAHRAELHLDVVKPIGQRHQLFLQRSGFQRVQLVLDAIPAHVHVADGILAGKPVHHRPQFLEFGAQAVSLALGGGLVAELVNAGGKPCEVVTHVERDRMVFGRRADRAHFLAQHGRLAGEALRNVLLQFVAQVHQRLRDVVHPRIGHGRRCYGRAHGGMRLGLRRARRRAGLFTQGMTRRLGTLRGGGGLALAAGIEHALALADFGQRIEALALGLAFTKAVAPGWALSGFGLWACAIIAARRRSHQPLDACLQALDGAAQRVER